MLEMLAEIPVEMDVLEIISAPDIDTIRVTYSVGGTANHYTYTLSGHTAGGETVRELVYADAPAAFSASLDFMLTAVGYAKTSLTATHEQRHGVRHYIRR